MSRYAGGSGLLNRFRPGAEGSLLKRGRVGYSAGGGSWVGLVGYDRTGRAPLARNFAGEANRVVVCCY